jgi:hypothetical protein
MKEHLPSVAKTLLCAVAITMACGICAAEAVSFQGESGTSKSFDLAGGQYSLYINAHFVPNARTRSANGCVFDGNLQRVSPTQDSMHFGPSVPVTSPGSYNIGPAPMNLPAGKYQLYIASNTDCHWTFSLESGESSR